MAIYLKLNFQVKWPEMLFYTVLPCLLEKPQKPYLLMVDASDEYSFGLEVTDLFLRHSGERCTKHKLKTQMIVPSLLSRINRIKGDQMS